MKQLSSLLSLIYKPRPIWFNDHPGRLERLRQRGMAAGWEAAPSSCLRCGSQRETAIAVVLTVAESLAGQVSGQPLQD